jgi:hypothetical protein
VKKQKFEALAATTKTGKPSFEQVAMNGGFKGEAHSYDSNRPKKPVVSRYAK